MTNFAFEPHTEENQLLQSHIFPEDWKNETPAPLYDLVVIGAGSAGLVTAAGAASLGARVALVEKAQMGGDCLNFGCVPSKALLHHAKEVQKKRSFGIAIDAEREFSEAMEQLRKKRLQLSVNDSVQRFEALGVDVFLGAARFLSKKSVEVDGLKLNFKKGVIATGGKAAIPTEKRAPGITGISVLTNESLFSLTTLPKRLAILGGGPIGCEIAQAFRRFGSEVHLFHSHGHILNREQHEAAEIVQKQFLREGVLLHLSARIQQLSLKENKVQVHFNSEGEQKECIIADKLLVSTGRVPNIDGLNLEAAGVEYTSDGVIVDDNLHTSNRSIFACGDVASAHKFTHTADFQARIVIRNALFFGREKNSELIIPRVTYTDPEIAHVGMSEEEAKRKGFETDSIHLDFSEIDRSVLESQERGFVEVLLEKGSDNILGATIVHPIAGEFLFGIGLAIKQKIGLASFAGVMQAYPTQGDILRKLGDAYNKRRVTPFVRKVLRFIARW